MLQIQTVRAFAILTLAAVLVFASSAPAHAAQRFAPEGSWGWLEVWTEGIAGLWQTERPVPSRKVPGRAKQGVCVDPNGCASALTGGPGMACSRFNDQGVCVDPNG
jgi:hypothetical protein